MRQCKQHRFQRSCFGMEDTMITPKDYFEKYLSWKRSDSGLRSAKASYAPFSALDLESLTAEAEAESPGAQEELGERYLFGLSDLKQDPQRAKELFACSAAQGNPDAMHMLAELHRTQEYGMFDYDQYFPLLVKSARAGSWKGMFNLSCALYKGKEAYEGHGLEVNKLEALKWSTHCVVMTMGLLDFYFKNPCSEDFKDYFQGVFALFIQSVCVSSRQLIIGDGVEKDLNWAMSMLTDAQNFYRGIFKANCSDFSVLIQHCKEQMEQ